MRKECKKLASISNALWKNNDIRPNYDSSNGTYIIYLHKEIINSLIKRNKSKHLSVHGEVYYVHDTGDTWLPPFSIDNGIKLKMVTIGNVTNRKFLQ